MSLTPSLLTPFASSLLLTGFLAAAVDGDSEKIPFLGVRLTDVPPALAAHLEVDGGALVADVVTDSPAAKAGVTRNDVVVAVAGEAITSPHALQERIRAHKPGDAVEIVVLRDAKKTALTATLGVIERPSAPETPLPEEATPSARKKGFLGVHFGPVHPSVAAHLELERGVGVSVNDVLDGSPAASAGIRPHAVILELDGHALTHPGDLPRLLGERHEGDAVEIVWLQRGERKQAKVVLAGRDAAPGHPLFEPDAIDPHALSPELFDSPTPFEHKRHAYPRHSLKGKLYWKDPEGKEHVFEMPEFGFPDPRQPMEDWKRHFESWAKKFQSRLDTLHRDVPRSFEDRLEKLLERYNTDVLKRFRGGDPLGGLDDDVLSHVERHRVAISRMVVDGLDITVQDRDGRRSFTVKRNGETLAENLDFDRLDTLPEEVREHVRRAAESLPEVDAPRIDPPRIEEEGDGDDPSGDEAPVKGRLKV